MKDVIFDGNALAQYLPLMPNSSCIVPLLFGISNAIFPGITFSVCYARAPIILETCSSTGTIDYHDIPARTNLIPQTLTTTALQSTAQCTTFEVSLYHRVVKLDFPINILPSVILSNFNVSLHSMVYIRSREGCDGNVVLATECSPQTINDHFDCFIAFECKNETDLCCSIECSVDNKLRICTTVQKYGITQLVIPLSRKALQRSIPVERDDPSTCDPVTCSSIIAALLTGKFQYHGVHGNLFFPVHLSLRHAQFLFSPPRLAYTFSVVSTGDGGIQPDAIQLGRENIFSGVHPYDYVRLVCTVTNLTTTTDISAGLLLTIKPYQPYNTSDMMDVDKCLGHIGQLKVHLGGIPHGASVTHTCVIIPYCVGIFKFFASCRSQNSGWCSSINISAEGADGESLQQDEFSDITVSDPFTLKVE